MQYNSLMYFVFDRASTPEIENVQAQVRTLVNNLRHLS